MADVTIKLQKYLADCGVASRRKCEDLIAAGAVCVNGAKAQVGDRIAPGKDRVTVNGRPVAAAAQNVYYMLHKPRGYITTMHDEKGRKCVAELIRDIPQRVYPVGRLDRDSEGLLLLTNDGEFANLLAHPSTHVPKTYRVTVRGGVSGEQVSALIGGVPVDGRATLPAEVRVVSADATRTVLEIVLREGRNRQIRKMCEAVGLEVVRLKRTKIGSLKLGMLKAGTWRPLTQAEVAALRAAGKKRRRQDAVL